MKKKWLSVLLAMAMTVSLAACGGGSNGGDNGGGDASGGASGDGKTLRVAIWDNNQRKGLQQIADEWSETSNVKVDIQVMDWTTYWTMLEAGVSGGEMPDVFWMHSQYAEMYKNAGVLADLNSYIAEDDAIDLENYYPGITELYSGENGEQFAIPKDHDTIAVIYNKAIFDKYGIDYPTNDWTWEEYADIAKEITEKGKDDGVYGTYMNCGNNQDGWWNTVYSFGGSIISEDRKASGMDSAESIKAMQFIHDEILPSCPSQDSMANTGGDAMMISGTIGLYPQGSWAVLGYYEADNKDDFGWVQMPWEDVNGNGTCDEGERATIYNGLGWSIYKNSEMADEAWGLVSALTCKEGQLKQAELGVTMAGYIGCSEAFAGAFEGMDVSPFVDIEETGTLVFRPYSKYAGRWADNMTNILVPAWNGEKTMEEVCIEIAEDMNSILAEE